MKNDSASLVQWCQTLHLLQQSLCSNDMTCVVSNAGAKYGNHAESDSCCMCNPGDSITESSCSCNLIAANTWTGGTVVEACKIAYCCEANSTTKLESHMFTPQYQQSFIMELVLHHGDQYHLSAYNGYQSLVCLSMYQKCLRLLSSTSCLT